MTRITALQIAGGALLAAWLGLLTVRSFRTPPLSPTPHGPLKLIGRTVNPIAGTGISLTTTDNTSTGQQDLTIASTVTGGVSSVTGSGSLSCSPTTGAVGCTSSLPDPVTVPHGGTSLTTLTSGNLVVGAGTSAPTFIAPNLNGNILCVNSGAWSTSCLPLTPGQGATGVSNPTAHSVAISEATLNYTFLNGASGTVLVGNGAGADPSFAASTSVGGILQTANNYVSLVNIGTAQSIGSIALTVGSGQKARIWCTVSVDSTDASGHLVRLDITGGGLTSGAPNRGQASLGNFVTGITGADETIAVQSTDTNVAANTYTATISKVDGNTVTGQLVTTGGVLRGDVTAN